MQPDPTDLGLRREAQALLALGWVPLPDEPGRIYRRFADMPPATTTLEAWQLMQQILKSRSQ